MDVISHIGGTVRDKAVTWSGRLVGGWVIAALFMGSTLLTPLYELYRDLYSLSPTALGLLYAVYVLGNLAALLLLGRVSDQMGRRPVVLAGLALAAVSGAFFLVASSPEWLFAGRVVSGLAVGLGSGAATAWITESTPTDRRTEAAATMTAFNFAGLALGPIVGGILAQSAPLPLRRPFVVYLAVLVLTVAVTLGPRETAARRPRAKLDLRPRLGVPVRLAFVAPAAAGFTAMAVVGFYAALGPSIIGKALTLHNLLLANLVVAELFVVAGTVIILTRHWNARPTLLAGLLLSPFGLGALVAAQSLSSTLLMIGGAAVCGGAAALGYRGGLQSANALAPPDRRAEIASCYFVCCFLGNALPVVGVAALSQAIGQIAADRTFAAVLTAVTVLAVACNIAFGRKEDTKR